MPFIYRRRVQFVETDLAVLVHFTHLLRYMEEAEHALWRAAGMSIARAGEPTGWPRLVAAFEFRAPLRFEDEFEVAVHVTNATARTLQYEFTVNDSTTWTRPWTAQVPMRRSDELMYEYACHEANYGMENLLKGARFVEKEGRAVTGSGSRP